MVDTSFKVSRQEYLELLDAILKKRRLSIINILAFLVMTVGQVALVTVNIVKYDIRGGQMALLIALSASICVIQLLYQFSTGLRARVQLNRSEKAGKINSEFWERQRLTLKDDTLTLACGKSRLSYDCAFFSGSQVLGKMLILNFTKDKTVHQLIVPTSALESCGGAEAFVGMLSETACGAASRKAAGLARKRRCTASSSTALKSSSRKTPCAARAGLISRRWPGISRPSPR